MRWWTLSTAGVFVHWSVRVALAGLEPHGPITHHCPKEGCCFPLPILGRSSPPSWATRPPESHWKGNRSMQLGGGTQWPILGLFPPISIQDTSLQSLWRVDIHWSNCNAREVPPLRGFQLMLALVMGQELVLTLGDPLPGVCGLGASCFSGWNSSTLKRINRK